MPKFYEVYGRDVSDITSESVANRKAAYCPFTKSVCDGGGNRHQTKINLEKSELKTFFNSDLKKVIPGICSIEYGNEVWIVCPRRLLGFNNQGNTLPQVNLALQRHEREALIEAGLPTGVELGVWPEVYLKYGEDEVSINYHFDFVIAPIQRNMPFSWLLDQYQFDDQDEIESVKKNAKTGKYIRGKYSSEKLCEVLPDLESPVIIEVMTASTSGSDTEAGTNISTSFTDAIMGRDHNCPGINKRQVWGRMATQLFAKSALAEEWGGKTVWLVQDELLRNIELTTKLDLSKNDDEIGGTINFLSMSYNSCEKGDDSVTFDTYYTKSAGLNFFGNDKATDILLPKINPSKKHLLKAILRRELSAIISL